MVYLHVCIYMYIELKNNTLSSQRPFQVPKVEVTICDIYVRRKILLKYVGFMVKPYDWSGTLGTVKINNTWFMICFLF